MPAVSWGWGADTLWRGIDNFEPKTRSALEDVVIEHAVKMVEYARANALWEDRTGDARAGLDASVDTKPNEIILSLFHTVDYGIWLEIRWGALYAIILPTLEDLGPAMLDAMTDVITGITYYD